MSTVPMPASIHREPELLGQTVVVIGGSAGIGFETARRAHAEGAKVILTGRNADRLKHAASEVDALSTAAFDAADPVALDRFFADLPTIDHVMVTAGRPYYGRLADMDWRPGCLEFHGWRGKGKHDRERRGEETGSSEDWRHGQIISKC
jgi:NAD(P)-dependent dehydrogenase (short-subunit alcohol dehydrogenase family)